MVLDYYAFGLVVAAVAMPFLLWTLVNHLRWSFLATWNMVLAILCQYFGLDMLFPIFAGFFAVFAVIATVRELLPALR